MNVRTRFFHLIDRLEQPIEAMELTRRGYRLTKGGLWVGPVHELVTEG